jgi:hypothetical protein
LTHPRQRRIKCDEEKPSCLRCERSGRRCGGYPSNAVDLEQDQDLSPSRTASRSTSTNYTSNASIAPLASVVDVIPWSQPQQQRFLALGQSVLNSDPFQLYSQSDQAVFSHLIPQLSVNFPSVNAAAAAFGAAYDSTVLNDGDPLVREHCDEQYGIALRLLQGELKRSEPQYAPLILASALLAAAETLQARQNGALAHVLGAFGVFTTLEQRALALPHSTQLPKIADGGLPDDIIDLLESLCLSIDLQVATFTWGQPSSLPSHVFTNVTSEPSTVDELCQEQPKLIHAALCFVSEASHEVFEYDSDIPYDLITQQAKAIAWLRKWLASYADLVETNPAFLHYSTHDEPPRLRNLYLLKAQVLSILIAVSNIYTFSQTSYDKYAVEFEEILRCAELILSPIAKTRASPQFLPFSPRPGIIQPLFLTARKYRTSLPRRQAIRLLRRTGFEGPFSGHYEADLATRFVEIEEARPFKGYLAEGEGLQAEQIPDWRRICSCWRLSEKYELDEQRIKFCRRRKAPAYRNDDELDGSWGFPKADSTNPEQDWEIWDEVLRRTSSSPLSASWGTAEAGKDLWVPVSGEFPMHLSRIHRDPDWIMSPAVTGEHVRMEDADGARVELHCGGFSRLMKTQEMICPCMQAGRC